MYLKESVAEFAQVGYIPFVTEAWFKLNSLWTVLTSYLCVTQHCLNDCLLTFFGFFSVIGVYVMFVLPMLNHEVSRRELKALFRISKINIAIQKAIILCRGVL